MSQFLSNDLTDQEWLELKRLRDELCFSVTSLNPEDQERYTALFVKSIAGKGDTMGVPSRHHTALPCGFKATYYYSSNHQG